MTHVSRVIPPHAHDAIIRRRHAIHEQFGTYGAWLNPALGDAPRVEYAPELEEFGFQTIWVGIGQGHPEVRDSYVEG